MSQTRRLLVVDDDPLILDCFRFLFPKGECIVRTAASAAEGLKSFSDDTTDVLILDVRLPDMSGLEACRRFQSINAKVPIILVTGFGTAETAIEAMQLGAYDYVVKPLDPESLRGLIGRAFEIGRLMRVPATLDHTDIRDSDADILVGNCPAMQEVYKAIGRIASRDVTTLILGESGTGKELVARAIYNYSGRAKEQFLAINCAAIQESLLESELFGHEKGAFTGADRRRIGKFEQCNRGTLFLDEVGDMKPSTQAKILRVLQDKTFERVGGNELIQTDVRIIAATNQNLEARIEAGEFRTDLYYRLNGFKIELPPLRDRGEDLNRLVEHFFRRFTRMLRKEMHSISPEAIELFKHYAWPGNVRELQSALKQSILQATGPVLTPEFLPVSVRRMVNSAKAPAGHGTAEFPDLQRFIQSRLESNSTNLHAEIRTATDRQLLRQVLEFSEYNLSRASRILGISRATLRSNLAVLGFTLERSSALENDE